MFVKWVANNTYFIRFLRGKSHTYKAVWICHLVDMKYMFYIHTNAFTLPPTPTHTHDSVRLFKIPGVYMFDFVVKFDSMVYTQHLFLKSCSVHLTLFFVPWVTLGASVVHSSSFLFECFSSWICGACRVTRGNGITCWTLQFRHME